MNETNSEDISRHQHLIKMIHNQLRGRVSETFLPSPNPMKIEVEVAILQREVRQIFPIQCQNKNANIQREFVLLFVTPQLGASK